jgi:hypothetical protein
MNYTNLDKFVLNIGLNVGNVQPIDQLTKSLHAASCLFRIDNCKVVASQYSGQTEKTLVLYCTGDLTTVATRLSLLSKWLKQECIAYFDQYTERGELIYSPSFKGDKLTFDLLYFKK